MHHFFPLSGGNLGDALKAGVIGGVIGGLAGGGAHVIGTAAQGLGSFQKELARSLAHGSIGGLSNMAQGGKFKHGFFAGAFASMAGSGMQASGWGVFQTTAGGTIAAAVVGGTASELGGGKFANGAVTGAYTMLFNHMVHGQKQIKNRPNKITKFEDKNIGEQILEWMKYIEYNERSGNVETIMYDEMVSYSLFEGEVKDYVGLLNAVSGEVELSMGIKVKYTIINPKTTNLSYPIAEVHALNALKRLSILQYPIHGEQNYGSSFINIDFNTNKDFIKYRNYVKGF